MYKSKLTTTCGLTEKQYDDVLDVAMEYDRGADDTTELITKVDKFTDDFIKVCGVETIECLGI